MLAVAELELLAPGEGFRDVHMNVLRRLQIDQDQGPEHRMGGGKADHQPKAGLGIAGRAPRATPPAAAPMACAARAKPRAKMMQSTWPVRSAFSAPSGISLA